MIAVFRVGLFSYWVNSYYGGAVPAIGGCLLLGALPRLRQRFTTVDGIWLATGIAILANSRPFEGVLVTIPALAVLLRDWWKLERPIHWVRRAMIPALLLMAVAVGMLYYNQRVFGNPLTLAYTVNRGTYAMAPVFLWQKPRPEPVYHNPEMKSFYTGWEMEDFTYTQSLAGFFDRTVQKFGVTFVFVFGVLLMPPLIGIMRTVRDRRVSYLWKAGLIMGAGMCVNAWLFPHYIAPFIGGFYVLLVQSMRHVRMWKIATRPVGPALMRVMAISCILLAGIRLAAVPLGIRVERFPNMWYGNPAWGLERAVVQAKFQSMPGQHLAIVRYKKDHLAFDEWVYNAADIDHSKVVWAREFDAPRNAKLLEYFKGRQVWLVEPDEDQPEPRPYKPKLEHADVTAQHRVTSSHQ